MLRVFLTCVCSAALIVLVACAGPRSGDPGEPRLPAPRDTVSRSAVASPARPRITGPWSPASAHVYTILGNTDDGTEVNGRWYVDGYTANLNSVGRDRKDSVYICALRFLVPDLEQGKRIASARLRLPCTEYDRQSPMELVITAAADGSAGPFSDERLPSSLLRAPTSVAWRIERWASGGGRQPYYYSSPDIAPLINQLLSDPAWGERDKALVLVVEVNPASADRPNVMTFHDYSFTKGRLSLPMLEVFPTVDDAFIVEPMLGRPTDTSVVVSVVSLLDLDVYVEYGTSPSDYSRGTPPLLAQPGGRPIDLLVAGLGADTLYYYRLRYRQAGRGEYSTGWEGRFHTQRARGSAFVFALQADSHTYAAVMFKDAPRLRLYEQTLRNVLADGPDFHIDLGDFSHVELYGGQGARTLADATDRYLAQRRYLGGLGGSAVFYLVLGNHEGEQGWRGLNPDDSLEVWGALARKSVIPNPYPDGFYSGNPDSTACCGLLGDYYAWEWGDALFVVLDPFRYTLRQPHEGGAGYAASLDGWDWTLGREQYDWLYRTLHTSEARWKFVLAHHMTGGVAGGTSARSPYGRGGIDAASFGVAGRPTFEWGGEDSLGQYVFDKMRPGWSHGPIHKMMVDAGVDIFFHGHDHCFVFEELDGVVYQTCPQPAEGRYTYGQCKPKFYSKGLRLRNCGHLRVRVSPDSVRVDYVRSVLPEDSALAEDGDLIRNRTVSYSYTLRD